MPGIPEVFIKVDGADIEPALMLDMKSIVVESSLSYPDTVTMSFIDSNVEHTDNSLTKFKPGKPIKISFKYGDNPETTVFDGEITTISPEFGEDYSATLVISGYDKRHRLMRGTKSKAYLNVKDSDIVSQIAGQYGLSPKVDATSIVHEHVFQDNLTDMAFLEELARRNGYQVYVSGRDLHFKKPETSSATIDLEWGNDLISFYPRLSAARQVDEVLVRGWDAKRQEAIEGKATTSRTAPAIGFSQKGSALAKSAFGAATHVEVRQPVISQSHADKVAQAILDEVNAEFIEADGLAVGNTKIVSGASVKIENVGTQFGGTYKVTNAKHFLSKGLYETEFRVEGTQANLLGGILDNPSSAGIENYQLWTGIYPAIVTNNNDSDGKSNRVKLKYPWLDDDIESHWARVISIGAGNGMGLHWLPEINDEVLVAFEHGNFNRPYVLGGVHSSKNKLLADVPAGKAMDVRVMRSKSGHKIIMDDQSGDENILIESKSGHTIRLDDKNKSIEIKSSGGKKIKIDDQGNSITIEGAQTVNIKSTGAMNLEANQAITVKANQGVNIEGTGPVNVKSSAIVEIKGSLVKIG